MPEVFSTADVGELLGVPTWKVRRLFEDGTLPDPPRIGRQRAITRPMISPIAQELNRRGWLPADRQREAATL